MADIVPYDTADSTFDLHDCGEDSDARLTALFRAAVFRLIRGFVWSVLESPLNRIFLLQCVQGELVRDNRLAHGSFGGIRGTVRYIIEKEGFQGLFRGAVANAIASLSALVVGRLAAFCVSIVQERLTYTCKPLAVLVGIASPALRIALAAPFVAFKDAMFCNYAADIVAPLPTAPAERFHGNAKSEKTTKDMKETYLYATPWEAVAAVRKRRGWRGFWYKCIDADIAAIYAMMLLTHFVDKRVMSNVTSFVMKNVQQPWRQVVALTACSLGVSVVYKFVTQPFYVIRTRMTLLPTAADTERRKPKYRYRNLWHCAKETVRRDGITSLWAGVRWQLYGQGTSGGEDVLLSMIGSLVGSFIQRTVMAPSYRITVLTAVEGELIRSGRLPETGFGGISGCVKRLYAKEGVLSFFRGLLTDAVLTIPSAFAEELSSALVSSLVEFALPFRALQSLPVWAYVTVSLCSTSIAVIVATPMTGLQNTIVTNYVADIVAPVEDKTTSQGLLPDAEPTKKTTGNREEMEESYKYESATQTAADIRRRWGWRGFYCGFGIDAMAVFLYRGTYYYALEMLPASVHERYPYALARCLAVAAGCITQPFEVISRRMVLAASSSKKYSSMLDCYRTIVAEEGYAALWSGLRARLLITCIGMAAVELRRLF